MRIDRITLVIVVGLLVLAGCSEDPAGPTPDPYPDVVVFREDVRVFDGNEEGFPFYPISEDYDFDMVHDVDYDPDDPFCEVGDIILRRPTDDNPDFYFRRITGIRAAFGMFWQVTTEQAELGDAIEYCRVAERVPLSLDLLDYELPTEGVTLDHNSFGLGDFRILDAGMQCESSVELVINRGSVSLDDAWVFVELVVEDRELVYFHLASEAQHQLDFDVTIDAWADCGFSPPPQTLYTTAGTPAQKPIVVMAGPVPLVFVPVISIYLGVNFNFRAGFSQTLSGVGTDAATDMGFTYDADAIEQFSGFNNLEGTGVPLELAEGIGDETFLDLYFKPYLMEQIKLMLYGVAGPTLSATQYLEAKVWTVYDGWGIPRDACGGVWIGNTFAGGLDIGILDQSIVHWDFATRDVREQIYPTTCYSDLEPCGPTAPEGRGRF